MQQAELFVVIVWIFPPIIILVAKKIFSSSLPSKNIHVPTDNNLVVPTKIKLLMINWLQMLRERSVEIS